MKATSLRDDELNTIVELVIKKLALDGRIGPPRPGLGALAPAAPGAIMEPFFQASETARSILSLLPLPHKRKWAFFFAEWGCLRCGQGENEGLTHASNGFCGDCRTVTQQRLVQSIKKRVDENPLENAGEAIARHRRRPLTEADLAQLTPETIMEPWFLPKPIESAIGQLVPISKQQKWRFFFLDWGCLRCGRTDRAHHCHGLCKKCHLWIYYHLGTSINRHFGQEGRPTPEGLTAKLSFRANTVQRVLAGEAVLPLPPEPEPAADPRAVYETWKKRLGRGCARMIDALDSRGRLSTDELARATGLTPRTVSDNLAVLRRNTLVESEHGRHVLRQPCERCRQLRQTLFQPRRKRSKVRAAKRLRPGPPVSEKENRP